MNATSPTTPEYLTSPNRLLSAANGIDYAYREVGEGTPPLVLLQDFRGNLDNWDPALIDALASTRHVVTFDNIGVGRSTGTTPSTVTQMARDAIAFLEAMAFERVDVLGFSIGSFVAQEIALIRPAVVRRLVLASSAPRGAAGMHGWAPEVIAAVGAPSPNPEGYLDVFFAHSATSTDAGRHALGRESARTEERDKPTTWQTRQAQYDAVCDWGIPDHALLERLGGLDMPVFVANGDNDVMVASSQSYTLAERIPNSKLEIYPDSGHGGIFQYHERFVPAVLEFLDAEDPILQAGGGKGKVLITIKETR